jgi:hypothetical protein
MAATAASAAASRFRLPCPADGDNRAPESGPPRCRREGLTREQERALCNRDTPLMFPIVRRIVFLDGQKRRRLRDETNNYCCDFCFAFAAGGAFAGEVKGPPGTPNNTNETGAPAHANSACAFSGLNDLDASEGQNVAGSDRGGLLEVLRASEGFPRHARTLQGRNELDRD